MNIPQTYVVGMHYNNVLSLLWTAFSSVRIRNCTITCIGQLHSHKRIHSPQNGGILKQNYMKDNSSARVLQYCDVTVVWWLLHILAYNLPRLWTVQTQV